MILENNNGILKTVKEIEFKLEKDIQRLVENNLSTLLSLEFIKSEFSIGQFRFDSVAYDNESNSFVIIEYKKGKNESLVDQGLTYLSTLLKRKADFVLLYNEVTKSSKGLKDFEWSQTRIVFISPKFTTYQLNAASFKNLPFSFYEIKQFGNNCIEFNEIMARKEETADFDLLPDIDSNIGKEINSEIKVYTEDDHLNAGNDFTRELYQELRNRILQFGEIKIEPKKHYIAFKSKTNVCDVTIRQKNIIVAINLPKGKLVDNNKYAKIMKNDDGSKVGHWGNGDYQCALYDENQIDYLITLIRQSYEANK